MEIFEFKLKSKNNANIFLANTDIGEFLLHSDIIVKFGIKKGENDIYNFENAKTESENLIAFDTAMKYVSGKLKTEKQVKDNLYKKGFHKTSVDYAMEKLKEYKIVDDKLYSASYIKSNPKFSKNKLKQKLKIAGVTDENYIDDIEQVDDFSSCLKNAEKYLKNKEITKENLEKLTRRLAGMGYNWDTIKSVLTNFKYDDNY